MLSYTTIILIGTLIILVLIIPKIEATVSYNPDTTKIGDKEGFVNDSPTMLVTSNGSTGKNISKHALQTPIVNTEPSRPDCNVIDNTSTDTYGYCSEGHGSLIKKTGNLMFNTQGCRRENIFTDKKFCSAHQDSDRLTGLNFSSCSDIGTKNQDKYAWCRSTEKVVPIKYDTTTGKYVSKYDEDTLNQLGKGSNKMYCPEDEIVLYNECDNPCKLYGKTSQECYDHEFKGMTGHFNSSALLNSNTNPSQKAISDAAHGEGFETMYSPSELIIKERTDIFDKIHGGNTVTTNVVSNATNPSSYIMYGPWMGKNNVKVQRIIEAENGGIFITKHGPYTKVVDKTQKPEFAGYTNHSKISVGAFKAEDVKRLTNAHNKYRVKHNEQITWEEYEKLWNEIIGTDVTTSMYNGYEIKKLDPCEEHPMIITHPLECYQTEFNRICNKNGTLYPNSFSDVEATVGVKSRQIPMSDYINTVTNMRDIATTATNETASNVLRRDKAFMSCFGNNIVDNINVMNKNMNKTSAPLYMSEGFKNQEDDTEQFQQQMRPGLILKKYKAGNYNAYKGTYETKTITDHIEFTSIPAATAYKISGFISYPENTLTARYFATYDNGVMIQLNNETILKSSGWTYGFGHSKSRPIKSKNIRIPNSDKIHEFDATIVNNTGGGRLQLRRQLFDEDGNHIDEDGKPSTSEPHKISSKHLHHLYV